ncbi:hypothetical protein EVAR_69296_1 [Eumeta japonica]|uniref:Uncharacterized protein n=1 Tax=Eumeta variegata TaxID=151549 RepID=A0A4C2ABG6_EUMVA|nr:hypothetical protein EVAR_69296_1 [Eumeta japonica]
MNSRNSVNEKNFVKYSSELSLNQFEVKERIEIPFDHIYACHSRSVEVQRPNLQLTKEVEITTQCVPADLKAAGLSEVAALRDRILRIRLLEMEKKLNNQRRSQNPPSAPVNTTQQGHHQNTTSQLLLNSNYTELLIPSSRANTFLFENDLNSTSAFRPNNDIKQESGMI